MGGVASCLSSTMRSSILQGSASACTVWHPCMTGPPLRHAPADRRRHVAFVMVGVNLLINLNFPFNPPFPTIGEWVACCRGVGCHALPCPVKAGLPPARTITDHGAPPAALSTAA